MTQIHLTMSALQETRWYEHLIRFVFGGLLTAATGFITMQYGPVIGGLFLAFPSIFPASVTLVQTHEKKEEEQKGKGEKASEDLGHQAAGLAAEGTALGSLGLFAFATIIYAFSLKLAPWLVLVLAQVVWLVVGVFLWWIHQKMSRQESKSNQT